MELNLVGSIYIRSFIKFPHFVPIRQQTWPWQAILVSDWLIYKKSSPLKPLGQMDLYLVWSIYGMCFMKFPHFIPIGQKTWPPWTICFWLDLLLWDRLVKWINILYGTSKEGYYKDSSFRPYPSTNMATMVVSCFWLADTLKIFFSETAWPNW